MHKRDILSCLRVSRIWYQAFLPCLWTDLRIQLETKGCHGPFQPECRKYWHWVRKLTIFCPNSFLMPCSTIKCPNLTYLEIHDSYRFIYSAFKNERSLASLIRRHQPSLRIFSSFANATNQSLEALSGCAKLEKLQMHLQCFKTLEDWLKWYGPLWSRQEALSWMGMLQAVTTSEDVVTDTMNAFSNLEATVIKSLDLDRSPYHTYMSALPIHVILIMKSPELIKLRWDSQDAVSILCRIAQTIPFGQNLKDLRLPSADMKSNDLKNLLTRLPKLEQLEIEHGKMDMDALGILRIESPRLLTIFKVLGLKGNISRTTGTLAHAILTSMPGLEEFSIDYITDVDICRGGGQWVCSGLKKLSMAVVLLEEGTQDMVLDMLGNLENLRTLDLSMGHIYRSIHIVPTGKHVRDFGLRISLGRGLDKLRMLHRLETYVGPQLHRTSQWKEAEARWILQHWTNLRTLREVCVNGEANDLLWFRVSGYRH